MMFQARSGVPLMIMTAIIASGCSSTGLKPLKSELATYNYTAYDPPRSNRGPGWTFRFVKTFDGKTVPMTVCENLYPDVKLVEGNLSIPNTQSTSSLGVDIALDLLEGLLPDPIKAKANLKNVRTVDVRWSDIRDQELTSEQRFSAPQATREINSACASALRDLKRRGELAGNVFIVQQALVAKKMTYDFKTDRGAGGELAGKYQDIIGFKAGANVTQKGSTILEISEPRYIGFRALGLVEWLPTGQLAAGETAEIRIRQLTAEELSQIIGR